VGKIFTDFTESDHETNEKKESFTKISLARKLKSRSHEKMEDCILKIAKTES